MIYKIAYCAFLLIHIGKVITDDEYSENWSNFATTIVVIITLLCQMCGVLT